MRCDDAAVIYIDGTEVGSTSAWTEVWSQEVTGNTRTIAIHCHNNRGDAGLIASFSNGLTTDNTWRCSHVSVGGWYEENFDDSDWNRTYIIQANDGSGEGWSKDNEFSNKAKWIWGSSTIQSNSDSYCRGKLSELAILLTFCFYALHNGKRMYIIIILYYT